MTDAAAFPGVLQAQTAIINPGRVRRGSAGRRLTSRDWMLHRVAELSHLLRITSRPAVPGPDGQLGSVAAVDMAVADAVRQQLTKPGSIPPQRQLQLIIADRAVHDALGPAAPAPADSGWTPFLDNVETRPYRPIAGIGSAMSDELAMKNVWQSQSSEG